MNAGLARTPLHAWHAAHGGRLTPFGGWDMPVQYGSIVEEHQACRQAVGLFDISHMGRIRFDGPDAAPWLDELLTRRVADMQPGQIRYALVANERGGVLDDVLIYRLLDAGGTDYHLLVVNASNRPKILQWLEAHPAPASVVTTDLTTSWAMIAVQGPRARDILQPVCELDLATLKYYHGAETRIAGGGGIVSRTGYTGEDGFEICLGAAAAERTWEALVDAARQVGGLPCGLGARDTLRLEAGMPLYGHELNEDMHPLQAGLKFAVDLDKQFIGRDAIAAAVAGPPQPKLVGLEMTGRRVPREGYPILAPGSESAAIGRITSGTFSPTFQKPIALGYVDPQYAAPQTKLLVDLRGQTIEAAVVKLPFYRRKKENK